MPPIAELIQQGTTNLWVFIPTAILLGALHGLEPGHSKTMMASFIIAVRGSMGQAVILGLCAALSHSLVVWVMAAAALHFGNELIAEQAEPYFMLLSAVVVIGVSIWMYLRARQDEMASKAHTHGPQGGQIVNTGGSNIELQIFEAGAPPRFRVHAYDHSMAVKSFDAHDAIVVETIRSDGSCQTFDFKPVGVFLESQQTIPEPHEFKVLLSMRHCNHVHRFEVRFSENEHHHHHGHDHDVSHDVLGSDGQYQDAHERAHAQDIQLRFAGRQATTWQIAMFGLTGGLIPCPASVTILMICLHLKRLTLGAAMVASFSAGLAISLVSVGVIAAWGARHAGRRFGGGRMGELARKMPYFSIGLMALIGALMAIQALWRLAA